MNFAQWKSLTETERQKIASSWSPYRPSEFPGLLKEIVKAFQLAYLDYDISGLGNVHGNLMLVVNRPFVFDKRDAPDSFLGLNVRYTLSEAIPEGFEVNSRYVWAPENYLAYVKAHPQIIQARLNNPEMSRDEMLHALVGMPFDDWIKQCQKWGYTQMLPGDRELPAKLR